MQTEINGDDRLSVPQRLSYLGLNFVRNLRQKNARLRWQSFHAARLQRTPTAASPSRALTEAFIYGRLPTMLPLGKVRVLEIGCGSGSLMHILAEIGYSGQYVGVDIDDRFDHTAQSGFEKTFVHTDVNRFKPEGKFDLVISVSSLEHIPNDHQITKRLAGFVGSGGLQLHFVPSSWGLPVYLWHGYRQYTAFSLAERFDPQETSFFAMGGGASFLLHFLFITVGEMLLRLRLRQRLPRLYGHLLDGCLQLDQLVPLCATMCAVCQFAAPVVEGTTHD
jgi:2-polyprenyl-3-methyl-5-hydroxy-6-metoxy-1,4-benzoquinol methylase